MDMKKSKVYVLPDASGRITRIDGGYTMPEDLTGWVLIDEGYGDRYNLCQGNYFPKHIMDERGIYIYKLVDGKPVERTHDEIDADYVPQEVKPAQLDRIEAQVMYTALMTDTFIEEV